MLPVLLKEVPVFCRTELEVPVFCKPALCASVLGWPPPLACSATSDGAKIPDCRLVNFEGEPAPESEPKLLCILFSEPSFKL